MRMRMVVLVTFMVLDVHVSSSGHTRSIEAQE